MTSHPVGQPEEKMKKFLFSYELILDDDTVVSCSGYAEMDALTSQNLDAWSEARMRAYDKTISGLGRQSRRLVWRSITPLEG